MAASYKTFVEIPSITDYLHLRKAAGLTPRSHEAAKRGLPNTVVSALIRNGENVVAMGRVIGDGLCYQIVDIAVLPEHQGRGLGKEIMSTLMDELKEIATTEVYISLIADGDASFLYKKYGFKETAPVSIGMAMWMGQ